MALNLGEILKGLYMFLIFGEKICIVLKNWQTVLVDCLVMVQKFRDAMLSLCFLKCEKSGKHN